MIMFNENANDDDDDTAAIKMRVNFFIIPKVQSHSCIVNSFFMLSRNFVCFESLKRSLLKILLYFIAL